MHIRIICLTFFMLITTLCNAQQESVTFTYKEVGWTITLPKGYTVIDSATEAASLKTGKKIMEESNGVQIDVSGLRTLISASKNQFSYFNATITPFDPKEDGNYEENNQVLKDAMFKTFTDQIPGGNIDSSSTNTMIDGIRFDKFQIKIPIGDNTVMTMIMLSRLHKKYDFGITYLYLDATTKLEIETMLHTSKFIK